MKIKPVPLTSASFAPYGDVIEPEAARETRTINDGHTLRFHDLATLSLGAGGGIPLLNIFRSTPLKLPLSLSIMERHPLSSQAFIPLSDNPYLVIVAPPGELDESRIQVFKASPKQGVNYHPGTWHHYSLALEGVSDFLVVDRGSPEADPNNEEENCDEVTLSQSIEIQL